MRGKGGGIVSDIVWFWVLTTLGMSNVVIFVKTGSWISLGSALACIFSAGFTFHKIMFND